MPRSNWLSNIATAGGLILIFVLLFALPFGVTVSQLPVGKGGGNVQGGTQNKQRGPQPAPAAEPSLTQGQEAYYYRPDCARPKNKEDALYCELRRLADSAKDAAAAAGETNWSGWFQVGAGVIAALVAALAANEARKATRVATAAARAAQRSLRLAARSARDQRRIGEQSADAAVRSADAAEHALRALERPYLVIEKIDATELKLFIGNPKPSLTYTVVNYGKTPAYFKSISVRLEHNPTYPLRLSAVEEFYAVVPPGKRLPRGNADDSARVEVEGSADYKRYEGTAALGLRFHGAIHYESADGWLYVERFGFRATEDAASFIPLGGMENYRQAFDLREKDPEEKKP